MRVGRRLRAALRIAGIVLLAYAVWVGGLLAARRWIVYPGQSIVASPQAGLGIAGIERDWLDIDGGRVEAWFLPGDGVAPDAPGPLVVYAHGNGELIDFAPSMLGRYRRKGISVLLPEYRGYGRSSGRPGQEVLVADFARYIDRFAARPEVDRGRVVFHGRSLGGGVVCALAKKHGPRALILESTYVSLGALAWRYGVPAGLLPGWFDNVGALAELDVPVLVIHGTRDQAIPFSHAPQLVAAARHARLVSFPDGHNDLPSDPERYWREIDALLVEAGVLVAEGARTSTPSVDLPSSQGQTE